MEQQQHRCCVCEYKYSTLSNLRKHVKKFHPDNTVPLRYNRSQNKSFDCSKCEKSYHSKQSLQRHIKTCHNNTTTNKGNSTLTVTTRNSKKCPLCSRCYNFKSEILEHFKDIHEVPIRCQQFTFSSLEAFDQWKSDMENETNSRFVKKKTKTSKSHTVINYVCHRSGNYLPEGKGKRHLKTQGSNKINAYCPSSIQVTIKSDEGVKAEFLVTHIGHETQVGHLQLTTLERQNIAAKLASKIPFDEILDKVQDSITDNTLKRIHLLTRKDLLNIEASFNLSSSAVRHPNDAIKYTYRGLIAPTLTPFKNDLERSLNLSVIPQYAKQLCDAGITGVLVNGTSGEGMSMNVQERKLVTEEWVKAVKQTKQHLMIQIGGAPLPDVLELAKHAEANKVDSMLCLPELYFKPSKPSDLINYLKVISMAAPHTPLLYYHIPSFTNVNIHMGQFLNEVADQIPTFCGIKFTSTLLDEGVSAVLARDRKFTIFLGADQIMAGAYALGFDSAIATSLNMFPHLGINILKSIDKSDLANARKYQDKLNKVIDVVTRNGSWVSTMKTAMMLITKIDVGPPRMPLVPLTDVQIRQMENELKTVL